MGGAGRRPAEGYFTAAEASRISRVPLSTLNHWARTGVITPSQRSERPRLYSFEDLRDLRVAQELRDQKARPGEIKAVIEFLRSLSGEMMERLAQAEVEVVGTRVTYRNRSLGIDPMEPSAGGQRVLAVPMKKIFHELGEDFATNVRELRPADRITISPDVRGGTPVIEGTRVPAQLVAELVKEGVPSSDILTMYPSLTADDLGAAVQWETDLYRTAH